MPRLFGSRFRFSVMKNRKFFPNFPLLLHQFLSVFNISKIFQDLGSFNQDNLDSEQKVGKNTENLKI